MAINWLIIGLLIVSIAANVFQWVYFVRSLTRLRISFRATDRLCEKIIQSLGGIEKTLQESDDNFEDILRSLRNYRIFK